MLVGRSRQLIQRQYRLFGFLLGTVLAGGGLYYYVVDEYKVSNELLVEDIYVSCALENHRGMGRDGSRCMGADSEIRRLSNQLCRG